MYNRYLSNDCGEYRPYPISEAEPERAHEPVREEKREQSRQDLLDRLDRIRKRLPNMDTGDLALLALLVFLYQEDADEELLIALGLLLLL